MVKRRLKKIIKNLMAPKYARLNVLKLALSVGTTLAVLYLGTNVYLMIRASQFSTQILQNVAFGVIYNLVLGFIGGCILAWVYNKLL